MHENCLTCGKPIYYSVDDVVHLHVHNRAYWCDAVEFVPSKGYVDKEGKPVDHDRYVRL